MLRFDLFGITFRLSFFFFAAVTLYLLADRTGIGACGVLAAATHELGHLTAYALVGERPKSVTLSVEGMRIAAPERYLTAGKELFVLVMGSGVNLAVFLLLFFCLPAESGLTRAALTQLVIGVFNLLPVGALDGGLILRHLLAAVLPARAAFLCWNALTWAALVPLFSGGAFLFASSGNLTLLVTAAFLLVSQLRGAGGSICNRGRNGVK